MATRGLFRGLGAVCLVPPWMGGGDPAYDGSPWVADSTSPGGMKVSATTVSTQQSGNYTFALGDANTIIEGTSGSAQTFTIPVSTSVRFPVGTVMEVFQDGAGQITIAAAGGVTLRSDSSKVKTAAQYATIGLRQRAQDEWVLSGDLA